MHNAQYSLPSYDASCLIKLKHLGWIEATLELCEDNGDMHYPHCGDNIVRYEMWYSPVTDSYYEISEAEVWVYLKDVIKH